MSVLSVWYEDIEGEASEYLSSRSLRSRRDSVARHIRVADARGMAWTDERDRGDRAGVPCTQDLQQRRCRHLRGMVCRTAHSRGLARTRRGPWISGMAETFQTLTASGASILLGTITWSFAAEMLRDPHGFAAVSGTEMQAVDGVLSGTVSRYFDEYDKASFVEEWCAQSGYSMSQVAAVGDSRSDIPLFSRAGLSIALNATPDARDAATHVLDTEDLRDVLGLLGVGASAYHS